MPLLGKVQIPLPPWEMDKNGSLDTYSLLGKKYKRAPFCTLGPLAPSSIAYFSLNSMSLTSFYVFYPFFDFSIAKK